MSERGQNAELGIWGCLGVGTVVVGAFLFHLAFVGVGASADIERQVMIVSGSLVAGGLAILLMVLRQLGK
jgi:carbonic anhydrase/acetyltransferase-like protein (isoleucine patch superfamily)